MGTEYELKYRTDAAGLQRIRDDFPGDWRRIPMTTTYYDTPSGAISARRWTLRHRMEGDRHICTLKTPAPGHARAETEVECDDIYRAIALLAVRSGETELPTLAAEGLIKVCGARFERQALTMEMAGCTGELALDEGVLLGGGRELPFAEVEAELKQGDRINLDLFGTLLSRKYALEREPRSKYARARQLAQEDSNGI